MSKNAPASDIWQAGKVWQGVGELHTPLALRLCLCWWQAKHAFVIFSMGIFCSNDPAHLHSPTACQWPRLCDVLWKCSWSFCAYPEFCQMESSAACCTAIKRGWLLAPRTAAPTSRSSNLPLPSLSDSEPRSHHQVRVCHTEMKTDPDWRANAYYTEGESLSFQCKYSWSMVLLEVLISSENLAWCW